MVVRFWALAVASIAFFLAAPAFGAPKVLVVTSEHPSDFILEATVRLRAELVAGGFEVASETDSADASFDRDPDGTTVAARGAIAAVRLVAGPNGGAVDLWVTDTLTHKLVVRRATEATPAMLALRCVELLRASLLEIEVTPRPAPVAPAVVKLVRARPKSVTPSPRAHLDLAGGLAVLVGDRGASLQPAPLIEAGLTYRSFRLAARWIGPSASADFLASSGTASVIQHAFFVEGAYTPAIGVFRVGPAIDVGGYFLRVRASPGPGFDGTNARPIALLLGTGLDASVALGPSVSVFLDGRVFFTTPSLVVAGNGERLATMGSPLWTVGLGLRVEL